MGPIAQSVEQRTFNPWVDGSSPSGPTEVGTHPYFKNEPPNPKNVFPRCELVDSWAKPVFPNKNEYPHS